MQLKEVISYASRKRRKDEMEGREHYFISKEKAEKMIENGEAKIKTYINGIYYFATDDEIRSKNCYKIDPVGLKNLKELYNDLNIKTIYIHCPTLIRKIRVVDSRGSSYKFNERNKSEDKQFNEFESDRLYDFKIENIILKESVAEFLYYISNNKADMYCIVGRTGSGKDRLIKEVNKILKNNTHL